MNEYIQNTQLRTHCEMSRKKLYTSRHTKIQSHWGRNTWDAIFMLAADFPHARECEDDTEFTQAELRARRGGWNRFFESLPDVLSCGACGGHFRAYMRRDGGRPFHAALADRDALFAWLHKAKDEVNRRTQRKSISLGRTKRRYIPPCPRR